MSDKDKPLQITDIEIELLLQNSCMDDNVPRTYDEFNWYKLLLELEENYDNGISIAEGN